MAQSDKSDYTGLEIAVVGLAGRFPGARDVDELWQNLTEGVEAITFFTDAQLEDAGVPRSSLRDPSYVKAAGVIDGYDRFDAPFFGLSPREAARMDPQQRIFLETAWAALESASIVPETFGRPIGVYAGSGFNTYLLDHVLSATAEGSRGLDYPTIIGNDKDFMTSRVSYKLGLEGPSVAVQTACSTSLVAIHLACQALISGECDVALAGGVTVRLPHVSGYFFQEEGIRSPDGHCRAFDEAACGCVPGSGAAVVVLKRLADALADGDPIRAVVKGTAINNDGGGKVGYTAPRVDGQAKVIADALEVAGTPADTIGYVEAHGTGTILGDPIEVEALTLAFGDARTRQSCGIGSIKTNLGHLDAAAGVAGFIKAVLSVEHGLMPPSLHYRRPNPRVDFENGPFFVVDTLRPWGSGTRPRRAGVSSFGIGGTNAHAIIEQAPPPSRQASRGGSRPRLFVVSAKNEDALDRVRDRLADSLARQDDVPLDGVAHTLASGRTHLGYRASFVAATHGEAIDHLGARRGGRDAEPGARVGFLFPGQGSQYLGMGRELYRAEDVFREHVDAGAELLLAELGTDLRDAILASRAGSGTEPAIDETRLAQPAIFVVSYAMAKLWESVGVRPTAMLGHSVGEYAAACLAGVFSFEDAARLVCERGRLMAAAPPGAMLMVSLAPSRLEAELPRDLEIAALNAPNLTVVSGSSDAIARFERTLRDRDIDHRRLRTSHGFHSASMDGVLEEFTDVVSGVERSAPAVPYLSNVTGTWVSAAAIGDPGYWAQHLRRPVRFSEGLAVMQEKVSVLLEVGPGRALTSLARRCNPGRSALRAFASMRHPDDERDDRGVWLETLGDLWCSGVDVRLEGGYDTTERPARVCLPTYPFERERHWIDAGAPDVRRPRSRRELADWFSAPTWQRLVAPDKGSRSQLTSAEAWIVFEDPYGVGKAFADLLEDEGQIVSRVRIGERGLERLGRLSYSIPPADRESYRGLVRDLEADGFTIGRIVHFWGVEPDDSAAAASLDSHRERGFDSILYLLQALGDAGAAASARMLVVTTQVQRVTGDDTLSAEKATVLGPVRVAPLEYPGCAATAVDIEFPTAGDSERDRIVGLLLATALVPEHPPVLAIRGGHRWSQTFAPVRLEDASDSPLRDGGVYMVVGGTGGIGLALAEHLARTRRAKLVLTGTTALPARSEWEAVATASAEKDFRALCAQLSRVDAELAERRRVTMSSYGDGGVEDSLDALCTAFAVRMLGPALESAEGGSVAEVDLERRLGIAERHRPLYEMLLRAVCDDGFVARSDGHLRLLKAPSAWPDADELENDILERYPDFSPLVRLLAHCLEKLASVLRGEEEALAVLYGENRELFRAGVDNVLDHSFAPALQALVCEVLSRLAASERAGPLRVLEIGGGEGLLTDALVDVLEDHDVVYHFTDIGKGFVVEAEKKARARGHEWMRFGLLDISRSPIPQGFHAGQFDVVIAFNVVHATPGVGSTLTHIHQLLAPGGIVVLQESVRPRRWIDCIWGLTEGWWLFDDAELRAGSPLLDLDAWERVVGDAGFDAASYPANETVRAEADSGVIIGCKRVSDTDAPETETSIPSRIQKLLSIEQLGAEVHVACADVSDRVRMEEVVRDAESRFGPIQGVVQAALVLDDGAMQLKTRESLDRVLDPKVRGTLVLEELFRHRDLDFFAMFSSLVSVLGGGGQVDYCAASNFQDAFATEHAGSLARTVTSIDWAAWRQTGKAMREAVARGAGPENVLPDGITTEEGIEGFERVLASALPQVLVSPNLPSFPSSCRVSVAREGRTAETSPGAESVPAPDRDGAPKTESERAIASIWEDLLGIDSMGVHDNFFELGADSVVSLQFIARAKKEGFHFSNAQVFELQTIAELLAFEPSDDDEDDNG